MAQGSAKRGSSSPCNILMGHEKSLIWNNVLPCVATHRKIQRDVADDMLDMQVLPVLWWKLR